MKRKLLTCILSVALAATVLCCNPMDSFASNCVDNYEVESNDFVDDANIVNANNKKFTINGDLSSSNDNDWYKLTLNKCTKINALVQLFDDEELKVEIYNSDVEGIEWFGVNYDRKRGYVYEKFEKCLDKGTYYINLRDLNGWSHPEGNYKITCDVIQYNENIAEPNDSRDQAVPLLEKNIRNGVIDSYEVSDYFKYKSTYGGYYYLTFKSKKDNTNFRINAESYYGGSLDVFRKYDLFESDDYIDVSDNSSRTELVKLGKGTTYFEVRNKDDYGMYSISLTKKPISTKSLKVNKYKSKTLKVTWAKAASSVTGYKLYRKIGKYGTYRLIKTIVGSGNTRYYDGNKTKGRTYYYKVCAYNYVNGYSCKGYFSKSIGRTR